ncbi:MAG: hypothetical protein Q7S74_06450 [Nanoarchaeota archaeon]|nr:hypothetical protein [Nanoarchaeota archaeon]
MVKCIVFAGNGKVGREGGMRALGYLDSLVDQGLFVSISNLAEKHSFIDDSNFDWFLQREFDNDGGIKGALSGMSLPSVYSVIRVAVSDSVNRERLNDSLNRFKARYGFDYCVYEY